MTKSKTELTVDINKKKIVEQNIDFPEFDEADLIRLDMNIIEYPLFSRNRKREKNQILKYYFNNNKSKYIEITPSAGDVVPGEFEKSVFISLTRILKDRGYPSKFVTTGREILNRMDISEASKKKLHSQVKNALIRMSKSSYEFNNTLYSSKEKALLNTQTVTKILEVEIITKLDLKDTAKYSESDLKNYSKFLNDGRVKEIFVISFGNHFYDNIVTKGYLVYSAPELLGLRTNGAAMDIYLLITKLRKNELYLKRGLMRLAGSTGFKFNGTTNIRRTKNSIEKACELLRERNLIKDFHIEETSSWKTAYIEFFFGEEHNKIKQDNFYLEKNLFDDIYVSQSDAFHSLDQSKDVIEYADIQPRQEITDDEIEYVFNKLPYSIKRLKTSKVYIIGSLKTYGTKRILQAIEYTKQNAKSKPFIYLKKAIEFNYGSKLEVTVPTEFKQQTALEFTKPKLEFSREVIFNKFMELPTEEQRRLKEMALSEALKKINIHKAKGGLYEIMHKSIINTFENDLEKSITDWLVEVKYFENQPKEKTPIIEKNKKEIIPEIVEPQKEVKEEIQYLENKEIKKHIDDAIELYADIVDMTNEKRIEIKKEIAKTILPFALKNKLTKEKLEELLQQEIEKL